MLAELREQLLALANEESEESDLLDYKREFSPHKKAAFWAETVKDIVAFANTRGGILIFGVEDDGTISEADSTALFEFDIANISNQIRKYTESDFSALSIEKITYKKVTVPAILVHPVSVPLVFTKVGTYEVEDQKQKTAFSRGTIYFRHGSKSEPSSRADIESFLNRRLEAVRKDWLGNIRKVIEAPHGSAIVVTTAADSPSPARITNDPNAPVVQIGNLRDLFPHTQKAVINSINAALQGAHKINAHDIQAIKCHEDIYEDTEPNLVHRPHEHASPQYSPDFVNLIIARYQAELDYFTKCRATWKEMRY